MKKYISKSLGAAIVIGLFALITLAKPVHPIEGAAFAEETLTVSTTTVGITDGLCNAFGSTGNPHAALLQVKDQPIYYSLTGKATVDSGDFDGLDGDIVEVKPASRFRAIRAGATDATVKIVCYQ